MKARKGFLNSHIDVIISVQYNKVNVVKKKKKKRKEMFCHAGPSSLVFFFFGMLNSLGK